MGTHPSLAANRVVRDCYWCRNPWLVHDALIGSRHEPPWASSHFNSTQCAPGSAKRHENLNELCGRRRNSLWSRLDPERPRRPTRDHYHWACTTDLVGSTPNPHRYSFACRCQRAPQETKVTCWRGGYAQHCTLRTRAQPGAPGGRSDDVGFAFLFVRPGRARQEAPSPFAVSASRNCWSGR